MKDVMMIFRQSMEQAGAHPDLVNQVMGITAQELIMRGVVIDPKPRQRLGQAVYADKLQRALNFAAPRHLWKWRTATEIAQQAGIDPTRSEAMAVAAALSTLGCKDIRKSNGRMLRLVPPPTDDL